MPWTIGAAVVGGMMTNSAAGKAADAQAASDAARLAEEQRVRQLLRQDTDIQRSVADQDAVFYWVRCEGATRNLARHAACGGGLVVEPNHSRQ